MSNQLIDWAFDQSDLEPAEKFILVALADYTKKGALFCFPKQATLEQKTGLSKRSIRRSLQALVLKGKLKILAAPGRVNRYVFQAPDPGHGDRGTPVMVTSPYIEPLEAFQHLKGGVGVKRAEPPKTPAAERPVHQKVIDAFYERLTQKLGEKPVSFSGGRAAKIASKLAREFPVAEVVRRMDNWFASTDAHIERRGWRVEDFGSYFNRLKEGPILARGFDRREEGEEGDGERPAAERAWLAKEAARIEREAEATRRSFLDDEVAVS